MEVVKDIAAIVGCVISIITLITLCTNGGRKLLTKLILKQTETLAQENKQQTDDIENIKDMLISMSGRFDLMERFSRQECRNKIKDIYYKYCDEKKIPLYERKTADHMYELYHDGYHGNSYAQLLYGEICKWEIIPGDSGVIGEDY